MAVSFVKNKLKYSPMPMVKPVTMSAVKIRKPKAMGKQARKAKALKGLM